MQILDWLSIPGLDLTAGTVTLSLYVAGGAVVLLLVLLLIAIFRGGFGVVLGAVSRLALVALAAVVAWTFFDRTAVRDRAAERYALDQRMADLTARAIVPGSILGCLEAGVGDSVEGGCERVVFAGPETVAAATAYVGARLRLLADGTDFAGRGDASYEAELVSLRRSMEADRFGFVAQVLATRDGCTASRCDMFALLQDANRVRSNLSDRTFEGIVARNAVNWPGRQRSGSPTAAVTPTPGSNPTTSITFPSASSIPPVSIMSNDSAGPVQGGATPPPTTVPAPPPRRPATRTTRPVQLSPPAATASAPPRTQ